MTVAEHVLLRSSPDTICKRARGLVEEMLRMADCDDQWVVDWPDKPKSAAAGPDQIVGLTRKAKGVEGISADSWIEVQAVVGRQLFRGRLRCEARGTSSFFDKLNDALAKIEAERPEISREEMVAWVTREFPEKLMGFFDRVSTEFPRVFALMRRRIHALADGDGRLRSSALMQVLDEFFGLSFGGVLGAITPGKRDPRGAGPLVLKLRNLGVIYMIPGQKKVYSIRPVGGTSGVVASAALVTDDEPVSQFSGGGAPSAIERFLSRRSFRAKLATAYHETYARAQDLESQRKGHADRKKQLEDAARGCDITTPAGRERQRECLGALDALPDARALYAEVERLLKLTKAVEALFGGVVPNNPVADTTAASDVGDETDD